MSKHFAYYAWDRDAPVDCRCGWTGTSNGHESYFDELLDIRCPDCSTILVIVSYPTNDEILAAAGAGNSDALAALPTAFRRQAFLARLDREELKRPNQLPELDGDPIDLLWDLDGNPDAGVGHTVILHGDREIWREPVVWEGSSRFVEVWQILRGRYGKRLRFLTPTPRSEMYLLGDSLSSSVRIDVMQFPDLEGDPLDFVCRFEPGPDSITAVLIHGERLIWRERSGAHATPRGLLQVMSERLRPKYGERLGTLTIPREQTELVFGQSLPDLAGGSLAFDWGREEVASGRFVETLSFEGKTIWRDLPENAAESSRACPRSWQPAAMLRAVYGRRFTALRRGLDWYVHHDWQAPTDIDGAATQTRMRLRYAGDYPFAALSRERKVQVLLADPNWARSEYALDVELEEWRELARLVVDRIALMPDEERLRRMQPMLHDMARRSWLRFETPETRARLVHECENQLLDLAEDEVVALMVQLNPSDAEFWLQDRYPREQKRALLARSNDARKQLPDDEAVAILANMPSSFYRWLSEHSENDQARLERLMRESLQSEHGSRPAAD